MIIIYLIDLHVCDPVHLARCVCQALETVGVDPRELTEADEFFGTAALKSYNTFVRPRPKQLAKVRVSGKPRGGGIGKPVEARKC